MQHMAGYKVFEEKFLYLFNSYYVQAGERHCRAQRGLVTRPSVEQVLAYRRYVDRHMRQVIDSVPQELVRLGIAHEEQHQELMLTDIQHVFWTNPMKPAVMSVEEYGRLLGWFTTTSTAWFKVPERIYTVGANGSGFHFDNEGPRHRVLLKEFEMATELVTNAEYLDFVEQGGYQTPALWLAAGWEFVQRNKLTMPLYWSWDESKTELLEFTLAGEQGLRYLQPVRGLSYYEADAYARWAGARLPTEFEWEVAADQPQMLDKYNQVWQWTQSAYLPYPKYSPAVGALGEYNGKWMDGAYVLRGGSFATPIGHTRQTYRNFWAPDTRWQYTGIRLARWV